MHHKHRYKRYDYDSLKQCLELRYDRGLFSLPSKLGQEEPVETSEVPSPTACSL